MKKIDLIAAGFFLILGFGMLILTAPALVNALTAFTWPTTEGQIVMSASAFEMVDRRIGGSARTTATPQHVGRITYEYSVAGITYTNERISTGFITYANPEEQRVRDFLARYPQGATVTVYYKPNDPQMAVLERGLRVEPFFLPLMSVGIILLGAFGLRTALRQRRPA